MGVLTKFSTSKHSYNQKALFLQGKRPNSSIAMQQQSSCFMLAVLLSCVLSTVLATPIPAAGTGATAAAEDAAAEAVSIVATEGEDLSETGATEAAEGDDGTAAPEGTAAPDGDLSETEASDKSGVSSDGAGVTGGAADESGEAED